jgi:hypothetical protein
MQIHGGRNEYRRFIRAFTAAVAMAVTGTSRWNPLNLKFWDHRPYSRIARNALAFLYVKNYVRINQLEAVGYTRERARSLVRGKPAPNSG